MGGGPTTAAADIGNQLSLMSIMQSKQQYNEQKAEKDTSKSNARANAVSNRSGANMAYSNMVGNVNNLSQGIAGEYSLLNTGGYLESLTGDKMSNKLGG